MLKLKFFVVAAICIIFLSGCTNSEKNIYTLAELNDSKYTIAGVVGTASEPYIGKVFPNATEKQFPSISDMVVALESNQVDGVVYTIAQLETVIEEKPGEFRILDEPISETEIHMVTSPITKLENLSSEVNEFLKAKKSDGTLERMYQYWFVDHKTEMPDIPQEKIPDKKIVIGTLGIYTPTSFYVGNELRGFDIELAKRFAAEYGYEIAFRVEDTASMLADTEFGKIDMISGSIMYTDERAERVIFPETPLYNIPISVMVKNFSGETVARNFEKPADLNDSKYTVGVVTGSATETVVPKILPKAQLKQFAGVSELILALQEKHIDAGAYSRPSLETALEEHPNEFKILEEPIVNAEMCMAISPRTQVPNLLQNVNEFLEKLKADGTIDKMRKYWITDKNTKMPDIPAPENPTQTLTVGTSGTTPPYNFYTGEELTGFDIELIKRFAHEYNYNLDFRVEELTSQLADTEFGKVDMLCGRITYTEERAKRVRFSVPVFTIPSSMIVLNESAAVQKSFFDGIAESFEKTLIREDRYKMILDGLQVTLILAIGSLILGTILGIVFCMLRRSSIKIISTSMHYFIVLISGLPIVLTLMICFYIVFSGTGLNEIIVAILAFSIDFGCYISITLNSGIESVSTGEIEAAEALGLSKWQVYRKIILPQAIRNIFGVYNRQVISLIKTTSIVGYIAVQDLTKVSDIIRARTYEAFFSLIFTAAIYFIIARTCTFLLSSAEKFFNRRRKNVAK